MTVETVSPAATESSRTTPSRCACTSFSIFIASITASTWPAVTVSPSATSTASTVPCIGVEVAEGDAVTAGQVLAVIEAMKMENEVHAHRDGVVRELSVAAGETVSTGQVVCVVVDE